MGNSVQVFNVQETISSLDVSKITGKRHDHIIRDIRNLLSQGVAVPNFGEGAENIG